MNDTQVEAIRQKVEGRRYAKEIFSAFNVDEETLEFREAFWLQVLELVPIPEHLSYKEEEAKRFEQTVIGFGAYSAHTYGNCPINYLILLSGATERLGAYLRSPIGQRRQENG